MRRRALFAGVVAAIAATTLLAGGMLRGEDEGIAAPTARQLVRAGLEEQQRARRTGEPVPLHPLERALRQALAVDPNDVHALLGLASLANTRHHFREGLALARRVRYLAPGMALVHGVIGDALIELGRYEAGFRAYDRMVELKPSIAAYARVAQAQSLIGKEAAARQTLELALDSAVDAETRAWAYVELGRLDRGELRLAAAARQFRKALAVSPANPLALEALGETGAARGELERAIALQRRAASLRFSPEFNASLGDLHTVAGNAVAAKRAYARVEKQERMLAENGVDTRPRPGDVQPGARDRPCRLAGAGPPRPCTPTRCRGQRGALLGVDPESALQGGDPVLEPGASVPRRTPLLPPRDDRALSRP